MSQSFKSVCMAATLVLCLSLLCFWEFASQRSRRGWEPFALNQDSFRDFRPPAGDWQIAASSAGSDDPTAPIILALALRKGAWPAVIVRLVHGYNMPDCMRIKQYSVALVSDARSTGGCQSWRLVSETDDVSMWTTLMLRAGDMSSTDVDIRDMRFPRVSVPDDPGWSPRGITREGLRHPLREARTILRAKWNASRTDLATFLRLRQPAWASREYLTLVASMEAPPRGAAEEAAALRHVQEAHAFLLSAIQTWWRGKGDGGRNEK